MSRLVVVLFVYLVYVGVVSSTETCSQDLADISAFIDKYLGAISVENADALAKNATNIEKEIVAAIPKITGANTILGRTFIPAATKTAQDRVCIDELRSKWEATFTQIYASSDKLLQSQGINDYFFENQRKVNEALAVLETSLLLLMSNETKDPDFYAKQFNASCRNQEDDTEKISTIFRSSIKVECGTTSLAEFQQLDETALGVSKCAGSLAKKETVQDNINWVEQLKQNIRFRFRSQSFENATRLANNICVHVFNHPREFKTPLKKALLNVEKILSTQNIPLKICLPSLIMQINEPSSEKIKVEFLSYVLNQVAKVRWITLNCVLAGHPNLKDSASLQAAFKEKDAALIESIQFVYDYLFKQ